MQRSHQVTKLQELQSKKGELLKLLLDPQKPAAPIVFPGRLIISGVASNNAQISAFKLKKLTIARSHKQSRKLIRPSVCVVSPAIRVVSPAVGLGLVRSAVGVVRPAVSLVRPAVSAVRPAVSVGMGIAIPGGK